MSISGEKQFPTRGLTYHTGSWRWTKIELILACGNLALAVLKKRIDPASKSAPETPVRGRAEQRWRDHEACRLLKTTNFGQINIYQSLPQITQKQRKKKKKRERLPCWGGLKEMGSQVKQPWERDGGERCNG